MRDKERFYPDIKPLLNNEAIERLIRNCYSEVQVETLLEKEGLSFSPDSIKNVFYALLTFREIQTNSPFSFLIYGSTATGTAGLEPRLQEFQFWKDEDFLGSTFRFHGSSDLDLRCLSEDPEEICKSLQENRKTLSTFGLPGRGIRIDSYDFALGDITDQEGPSFYRGVLVLNRPLVLCGRDKIDPLAEIGIAHITSQDFNYEAQRRQSKVFARSRLRKGEVLHLPESQLRQMFPLYYDPINLKRVNIRRRLSFRVSMGLKESSLIAIQVENLKEVDRFNRILFDYPKTPFREIRPLI